MAFSATILRLFLTAMLAFSTPLCLCASRAQAALPPASCCSSKPDNLPKHACCAAMQPEMAEDDRPSQPCDHQGSCACQKRPAFTAPATDHFTPPPPALLDVLAWPPMTKLLPAQAIQARARAHEPAALPRTPLLRQHCALIV